MVLELNEAQRKTFDVTYVEVTFKNIEEAAGWCKGTVVMEPAELLGAKTELPAIKLKVGGPRGPEEVVATLGSFLVEQKGRFRVYKPLAFARSFDPKPKKVIESANIVDASLADGGLGTIEDVHLADNSCCETPEDLK